MRPKPRVLALTVLLLAGSAMADAPRPLHVMAFNVLFRGADDVKSVQAIVDESPDVVCLTELTAPFITTFEAALAKDYPYRAFVPQKGTWGVGLASKVPLRNVTTGPVAPSRIPAMDASLTWEGRRVHLTCVHLVPPVGKYAKQDTLAAQFTKNAAVRERQAATLVKRLATVKDPVVLLGDFNEEPGNAALNALEKAGFARGCLAPGSRCTPTFPGPANPWPAVFIIDHVFARGAKVEGARTLRSGGSDHFPVSARVRPEAR